MWRERWGQRLVALGLIVAIAALLAIGVTRQLAHTGSVQDAAGDLLAVETWSEAVAAGLGVAFETAYPTLPLSAEERDFAIERMLANGDLVDDVQRAIAPAHRAWLEGAPLQLELDPVVTTRVAVAGVRDANPALIDQLPSDRLVEVPPVTIPTTISAATVESYRTLAVVVLVVALVALLVGVVVSPDRARTLKKMAMALLGLGVLAGAMVLLLPWDGVNQLSHQVEVVGALLVPVQAPVLVAALVCVLAGWWLYGSAARMAAQLHQSLDVDRRRRREATPARSGGTPSAGSRKAGRHRAEAIDAFFEPADAEPPERVTVIDLGELEGEAEASDEPADEVEQDTPGDDAGDDAGDDDPTPPAAPTPEDERAAALAAERREALERIDGTRGGYRTHLPR